MFVFSWVGGLNSFGCVGGEMFQVRAHRCKNNTTFCQLWSKVWLLPLQRCGYLSNKIVWYYPNSEAFIFLFISVLFYDRVSREIQFCFYSWKLYNYKHCSLSTSSTFNDILWTARSIISRARAWQWWNVSYFWGSERVCVLNKCTAISTEKFEWESKLIKHLLWTNTIEWCETLKKKFPAARLDFNELLSTV